MGGLLWNTAALSSELRQPPYGPAPTPLDGPELLIFISQRPGTVRIVSHEGFAGEGEVDLFLLVYEGEGHRRRWH